MKRGQVVILGGGLAGLSCAYHLKRPVLLIEREHEVGGTARSVYIQGFTFDFTGHLLHLHHPYTKKLIRQLLKNNLIHCQRRAWIYSHGTYTRYPFQANTYGLPSKVIQDCLLGLFKAQQFPRKKIRDYSRLPLSEWCLATFGEGISKHFMFPYNRKLWRIPLQSLTADWCGPFVPQPQLEDVLAGALTDHKKAFGYNATFLYPRKGGIQSLAQALAKPISNIRLNTSLHSLNWRERILLASQEGKPLDRLAYTHLVSNIPLVELLKRMIDLPPAIQSAAKKLRWTSVLCVNLGVKRSHISDKSWIYFPEKKFVFYRVGFPMNFTAYTVPKGCSSMYIEISHSPSQVLDRQKIFKQVRQGLLHCGILRASDKIAVLHFLPIRYAYVLYDQNRSSALKTIFKFLHENKIHSIGRYGAWKYSFMEEAILDGKKTAEAIEPLL